MKIFYLERRHRPHVRNSFFYGLVHRETLVSACDQDDDLLGVHNSCNANGQSLFRDFVDVVVEESRVRFQSVLSQCLNASS